MDDFCLHFMSDFCFIFLYICSHCIHLLSNKSWYLLHDTRKEILWITLCKILDKLSTASCLWLLQMAINHNESSKNKIISNIFHDFIWLKVFSMYFLLLVTPDYYCGICSNWNVLFKDEVIQIVLTDDVIFKNIFSV